MSAESPQPAARTPWARIRALLGGTEQLEDTPPEEQVRVATCVLLLEVARADGEFTPEEHAHIMETLRRRFALSEAEADDLLQTSAAARRESMDLWRFTHRINAACSRAQKLDIIAEVWRVILADGTLDAHEDFLVHKLARLLNLAHPDLISQKLRVREELSQRPGPGGA